MRGTTTEMREQSLPECNGHVSRFFEQELVYIGQFVKESCDLCFVWKQIGF